MKRFMLTVAAAALVPALAVAESHSAAGTMDEPKLKEQTQASDMMKPKATDMAESDMKAPEKGGSALFPNPVKISAITGMPIYTISAEESGEWDIDVTYNQVADNWERIGSVEDVVISADGRIEGVLAEVGGFLGMGDKLVMLPLDEMKMVQVDESAYSVVTPFTTNDLTDMEAYEGTTGY